MDRIFEIIYNHFSNHFALYSAKMGFTLPPYAIEIIYWVFVSIFIWLTVFVVKKSSEIIKDIINNANNSDLLQFLSKKEIKSATKNYINTHGQKNDPSTFLEPQEALKFATNKVNMLRHFTGLLYSKQNEKGIYLILGDSGMGKTIFLINLFLKYKSKIFLKKRPIFYIPLSDPNYKPIITNLLTKNLNSILLLDAFDENIDAWSNPEESLKKLLELVSSFSTVIITSRGQFFTSKIENFHQLNKFYSNTTKKEIEFTRWYISPIRNRSVILYLLYKYIPLNIRSFISSLRIVRSCPNLVVRPMLLNNVDFLIKGKKPYSTTVEIYNDLIISWIEREKKYIQISEVIEVTKKLAENIYMNRQKRKGLFITENEFSTFLKSNHFQEERGLLKTRGLLNRTENKIKFSHKSIFEYFLAINEFDNLNLDRIHKYKLDNPFYLDGLSDAFRFHKELFLIKITIPYLHEYGKINISIGELMKLKTLNLSGSRIKTLDFLKEVTWVTEIDLSNTIIRNLKPLHSMKNLKKVKLLNTHFSINIHGYNINMSEAETQLDLLIKEIPNIEIIH